MIGILGGGFGLYGWLPAVATQYPNQTIMLEKKHKDKFDKRPELQQFSERILWTNYLNIINISQTLILAIPPNQVNSYVELILCSSCVKTLIVEKPICETPDKTKEFIKVIKNRGINIVSPFLFIFSDWFADLKYFLHSKNENEIVTIDWFFRADHFQFEKDNWKKDHKKGGGPLRFYGIHLIAVLAELGYISSRQSLDESCYCGVFTQENYPDVIVRINTNADEFRFKVENLFDKMTPFNINANGVDNRIPNIINMLKTMEFRIGMVENITKRAINLWAQVEEQI